MIFFSASCDVFFHRLNEKKKKKKKTLSQHLFLPFSLSLDRHLLRLRKLPLPFDQLLFGPIKTYGVCPPFPGQRQIVARVLVLASKVDDGLSVGLLLRGDGVERVGLFVVGGQEGRAVVRGDLFFWFVFCGSLCGRERKKEGRERRVGEKSLCCSLFSLSPSFFPAFFLSSENSPTRTRRSPGARPSGQSSRRASRHRSWRDRR